MTLADFLMENEGKRCVVVLDVSRNLSLLIRVLTSFQEIEKTENEKVLSSLLMPWELGTSTSFTPNPPNITHSKLDCQDAAHSKPATDP